MKRLVFAIIIFISVTAFKQSLAYDTSISKYMPLQIGNIWVYYGEDGQQAPPYQSYWFGKYRITETVDTLGKRYYKIQETIVQISGSVYCSVMPRLIRIDSTTMNIYSFVNGCGQNENETDSLESKKNDTTIVCYYPPYNKVICTDTSNFNIFGNTFPSKYFVHMYFEGGNSRKFAKSIGIIYESYACMGCGCNENLIGCFINGVLFGDTSMIVGLQNISSEVPNEYSLYQNYPNPFNPSTKIKFGIPSNVKSEKANVKLIIYDVLGREVTALVNEQLSPGTYEVEWNTSSSPSGVYFYELETSNYNETKKMLMIK